MRVNMGPPGRRVKEGGQATGAGLTIADRPTFPLATCDHVEVYCRRSFELLWAGTMGSPARWNSLT
jgi:hypothetical protein